MLIKFSRNVSNFLALIITYNNIDATSIWNAVYVIIMLLLTYFRNPVGGNKYFDSIFITDIIFKMSVFLC